jgi:hypothetical protein
MLSLAKEAKEGLLVSLEKIRRVLQLPPVCPSASYRQTEDRPDLAKVPPCRTQRRKCHLTLNLLTSTIVAPASNDSKWQMEFNSAFKGLREPDKLDKSIV